MKKFLSDNKINFLFLFISFFCLLGILGIENISFRNTSWLHDGDESTYNQLSWYFFQNDIWRFPLGSNPNYGEELSNSIVLTDSVPLLAFFFKFIKPFIQTNFQYFSFWYFICFFLQLFFSYQILKKFTDSIPYSIVGSLFFLIAPIFIYRIDYHVGLSGQWLLLCTLYLGLIHKIDKSKVLWILLIILSSLIFLYFTVTILIVYSVLRILNFYFEKENLFKVGKDFFIISVITLLTLYIAGYFEIRFLDSVGMGFGNYKLNFLSIFDPVNSFHGISWSWFLPDIKLSAGEEIEGFNYFGLGQWIMFLFALSLFISKNYRKKILLIENKKEIKIFLFISFFFTFWALSNKISLGSYTFEIPINEYIFGTLSLFKATGRLFWIVTYFLMILSIIIIYKCFDKKKSISILILLLTIQIADTSAGIKKKVYFNKPLDETIKLKDQIWDDLFKRYKIVKTTYPINWSRFVKYFAPYMEKYNIEKTNVFMSGRVNRKAAAEARYELYDNFREKKLSPNTVYLVESLGHLRHLKYLFNNENVGFFFRDNIWSIATDEKELMNDNDKKIFNEIKPKLLQIDKIENLYFEKDDNYYGFGWSHNFKQLGIWSEGTISTLFFKTEKNYGSLKLEIFCNPHITKKNDILQFDVYVNNSLIKNISLTKNNLQDEKIEIEINKKFITNNEIKIDFYFKNPVSPYEVLDSPDSRKLGILVKNVKISQI